MMNFDSSSTNFLMALAAVEGYCFGVKQTHQYLGFDSHHSGLSEFFIAIAI